MKSTLNAFTLIFIMALALSSCGKKKPASDQDRTDKEPASAMAPAEEESPAVSIYWGPLSLRAKPERDGKYLTAIRLGEKMTYLGITAVDSASKNTEYARVRLMDGTEGWAQANLIVINGDPAVMVREAEIYSRPDLLTKTDRSYAKMDVVAVTQSQGDWVEVKGKRKEGSWVESGWIKPINISYETADIAVAVFTSQALAKDKDEDKIAALKDIIQNADLSTSELIPAVIEKLDELQAANEESMDPEEGAMESSDD